MRSNNMEECPYCREKIDSSDPKCQYCDSMLDNNDSFTGESVRKKRPAQKITIVKSPRKKWLLWVPVLLILIVSLVFLGESLATPDDDFTVADDDGELIDEDAEESIFGDDLEVTDLDQPGNDLEEAEFAEDLVTVDSINRKYEPKFEALEDEITAELIKLFNAAMQEYEQANGGVLFQLQLVNKYMRKVRQVESRADERFYKILDQMEEELVENDLSTAIISELEEDYLRDKQEKKRELTNFLQNPNLD